MSDLGHFGGFGDVIADFDFLLCVGGFFALTRKLLLDDDSYLVDPASSHMLVSKIKPCMSKYKHVLYCETADGSLYQL